jgi:WD40 repeat protein
MGSKLFINLAIILYIVNVSCAQENIYKTIPLSMNHSYLSLVPEKYTFLSYGWSSFCNENSLDGGGVKRTFSTNKDFITNIDISANSELIVVTTYNYVFKDIITGDDEIHMFDRKSAAMIYTISRSMDKLIDVKFSNNSDNFAVCVFHGIIDLYESQTGDFIRNFVPQKIPDPFYAKTKITPFDQDLPLHASDVFFSRDDKYLLSYHADWYFRVWNIETGERIGYYASNRGLSLDPIVPSHDQKTYLKTTIDTVELMDAETDQTIALFPFRIEGTNHNISAYGIYSPDNKYILRSDDHHFSFQLFDATTQQVVKTFVKDMNYGSAEFSKDGKTILIGTSQNTAILWDISDLYPSTNTEWVESK